MSMAHPLLRLVAFFAVGALGYIACRKYYVEAVPIWILFWGAGGAKHFASNVVDFVPWIAREARRSVFEKWNGRFYVYDNRQIRFCLVGETVWIVEADVRSIIDPPVSDREKRLLGEHYSVIPGLQIHGYSEAGLLRLISVRLIRRGGEAGMKKFMVWLQSESIPNVKRHPSSSTT